MLFLVLPDVPWGNRVLATHIATVSLISTSMHTISPKKKKTLPWMSTCPPWMKYCCEESPGCPAHCRIAAPGCGVGELATARVCEPWRASAPEPVNWMALPWVNATVCVWGGRSKYSHDSAAASSETDKQIGRHGTFVVSRSCESVIHASGENNETV